MLTYKQSYDKIIDAYFKDEIQPFNPEFCFCGTLCDGSNWFNGVSYPEVMEHCPYSGYTGLQLGIMGKSLLDRVWNVPTSDESYEDELFAGMSAALDVLKQIHIERGEVIDEDIPAFTKRELVTK